MAKLRIHEEHRIPRIDLELMTACDHACGHCYNVWGANDEDPQGGYPIGRQLPTEALLQMIDKAMRQTGARHVTITGGEPLLRKDALTIIGRVAELAEHVQLITNGSHVPPETARALGQMGISSVQLTLLSADRDRHNALKGSDCFDDTVRAALDLHENRVPVQICFVAMKENWRDFEGVMELCFALGVKRISYNRMSPAGCGVHQIDRLLPDIDQIEHNLAVAQRLGPGWRLQVHTAMPIPPCLIRMERYPWVKFGFCSTGTSSPNIVIDPQGNVRSCNLSSAILGNIRHQDWTEIYPSPYQQTFKKTLPTICQGCHYARSCQGGCKESGHAAYGAHHHPEPLLRQALSLT